MNRQHRWISHTLPLVLGFMLSACDLFNSNPFDRWGYQPLDYPPALTGSVANPEQATLKALGIREKPEGRFTQDMEIAKTDLTRQVILLTKTGLNDDSVRSRRYRLEFRANGSEWRLVWIGQQQQCWPDRGSTTWTDRPCI